MILPDANLLLYAYDAASPFHAAAKAWWETLLSGDEEVGLCPVVLFAFIRVGSHSRAFKNPMRVEEAAGHVREWLSAEPARFVECTESDVEAALSLLEKSGAGGNLTTDAQLAAVALRLKATVETADTDFTRFGVRWRNPIAGGIRRKSPTDS